MNKFKKWLIHKLGGYCSSEILKKPINVVQRSITLETIQSDCFALSEHFDHIEGYKEEIIEQLKDKITSYIKPEITFTYYGLSQDKIKIHARIDIPSKYLEKKQTEIDDTLNHLDVFEPLEWSGWDARS